MTLSRHVETVASALILSLLMLLAVSVVARSQIPEQDFQWMLQAASRPVASAAVASISDPNSAFLVSLYYHGITNTTSWADKVTASANDMTNKPNIATGPTYTTTDGTTYPVWRTDGSDDYFINYSLTGIKTLTKGTIILWIKFVSIVNAARLWDCDDEAVAGNTFAIINQVTGGPITVRWSVDGVLKWQITTTGIFETNKYYCIALVHNGTSPSIYTNNVLAPVTTNTATDLTPWFNNIFTTAAGKAKHMTLGAERWAGGTYAPISAYYSDVRIYNTNFSNFAWYITNTHPLTNLEQNGGY